MDEEWKSIMNYEKRYEVSNFGRVKNVKSGRILKLDTSNGYLRAHLFNKERKWFLVHRLVLGAFKPTEEDLECDHINHIRTDNRLENLRWVTTSQNIRYRIKREGLSSQYIGVCWNKKDKKWKVSCGVNYKKIHIGCFVDEKDAGKAYNDFVIKHDLQDFNILNEII